MDALKDILKIIKPVPAAIAVAVLVVVVGLSAARCTSVHQQPAESTVSGQHAGEEGEAGGPDANGPTLSEAQRALVEGYSQEELDFAATLEGSIWTAQKETKTLAFDGTSFAESDASTGQTSSKTYAIEALEESTEGQPGTAEECTVTTAALLTDQGTVIVTLRQFSAVDGQDEVWSLTSDSFAYNRSYVLGEATKALEVTPLDEGFATLIDGRVDELEGQLTEYCARFFPTAAKATWSGKAEVDWAEGRVTTSFALDTASAESVPVSYDTGTGIFAIG